MSASELRAYTWLSNLPRPTSYTGKILLVAFVGTHIPLLGVIAYTVLQQHSFADALPILLVALVATLVGTAFTLLILHHLLAPIRRTTNALQAYVDQQAIPDLPTDYTDRAGVLMRETQHAIEHLESLQRFRSRMLGVVSHDARGAISSVVMAANAIAAQAESDTPDPDFMRRMNDRIEKSVAYQVDLMQSLLDVARHGEGMLRLSCETASVHDIVDTVQTNVELQAHEKNHILHLVRTDDDTTMHTDVRKVEQVLTNLVGNAIKYTPPGGTICLGADVEENVVVFEVSDNGEGIPPDVQKQLFDAYQQANADRSDGVGLGLWITQTFVDALGGSIAVDSTPGEGSTFTVRLPMDLHPSAEGTPDRPGDHNAGDGADTSSATSSPAE